MLFSCNKQQTKQKQKCSRPTGEMPTPNKQNKTKKKVCEITNKQYENKQQTGYFCFAFIIRSEPNSEHNSTARE